MAVNLIKWMILINLRSHKATFLISTCDSDQRYCIHLNLAVDVGIKVQIGWPDWIPNPQYPDFTTRFGQQSLYSKLIIMFFSLRINTVFHYSIFTQCFSQQEKALLS